MAEWHCRQDAGLGEMDMAAELRGQASQVEQVDLNVTRVPECRLIELGRAPVRSR